VQSSRCFHANVQYRNSSNGVPPDDFQSELDGNTYCPPLAEPLPQKPHHEPIIRTLNILGITGRKDKKLQEKMQFPHHTDIVIIGGGIMGCSAAYWLKEKVPALNVVVVERDPTYSRASTVLSVGGLRQQFSLPENIQMSLYGAEFLRKSKKLLAYEGQDEVPDVQFHPHGYLFMASEKGAEQLQANHKLQSELGAKVELLSSNQLKKRFPWINNDSIELACFGLENEGWFDPWSLLKGIRNKALAQGTIFVKGEAVGFETETQITDFKPGVLDNKYKRLKRLHVYIFP
jgi:FAD-dependent oxidoreductase domain-containing protein 1